MTLKNDLIAAKALIDTPEKWGKGSFDLGRGCYCALGALGVAQNGRPWGFTDLAAQHLIKSLPKGWASVACFNDDFHTTHADVMALFDRAIEAAE